MISTRGTHQSGAYTDAFAAAPHVQVSSQPCPRFVEFVEAGTTSGPELLGVAAEYLAPVQGRVDTSSSAARTTPCSRVSSPTSWATGSPSSPAPRRPPRTSSGSSPTPTRCAPTMPEPEHEWLTTGDPDEFARLARRFLGPEAVAARPAAVDAGTPLAVTGEVGAR